MVIKEGWLLWFTNFLIKSPQVGVIIRMQIMSILWARELHKPIIRNVKKRPVYSRFKDNIWGADLADTKLISKFNEGFRFLFCVNDFFSKYAWVVSLKDNH